MHCTSCGFLLSEPFRFCPSCGHEVNTPVIATSKARRVLQRSRTNRRIAGVCAAVADHLNWDVTLVRITWLILIFGAGTGVIAYLIAWIVIPNEPKPNS